MGRFGKSGLGETIGIEVGVEIAVHWRDEFVFWEAVVLSREGVRAAA